MILSPHRRKLSFEPLLNLNPRLPSPKVRFRMAENLLKVVPFNKVSNILATSRT